ncbi:MAG: PEP-CTERM sorting domain-containing protein [Rhodospirillaceae bacterium]|nr:PEP-CTERM sorting domain-containing protein [Rhodospirillaceae bacterium]
MKRSFLGMVAITVFALSVSAAQAVPSLVTSRALLAGDDFFNWGQLGGSNVNVAGPANIISNSGMVSGMVNDPDESLRRVDQGAGWSGNFANGDRLMWTNLGPGPMTIDFDTGVLAAGAQMQQNVFGAFTGTIEAFDSMLNMIASFNVAGTSNSNGDNSAVFLGIATMAGDPLISRLTFNIASGSDFAINQLDIVKSVMVIEPGTLGLFGLGLAGLGLARRRKTA